MKYNVEQYSIFDKETGMLDLQAELCINLREITKYTSVTVSGQRVLDLIAYEQYGSYELWWVLAVYNKILNPFNITAQTSVIHVPDFVEVQNILVKDLYA